MPRAIDQPGTKINSSQNMDFSPVISIRLRSQLIYPPSLILSKEKNVLAERLCLLGNLDTHSQEIPKLISHPAIETYFLYPFPYEAREQLSAAFVICLQTILVAPQPSISRLDTPISLPRCSQQSQCVLWIHLR